MGRKGKDITGLKFGRLTAIEPTDKRQSGNIIWKCQCDCGNEKFIRTGDLYSNATKSCGCLNRERITTHGMYKSSIYTAWDNMIQRCENIKCPTYKYYGGRGIKICERWHKFENFYEDMGDKPPGLSIDRIDNEGNYEPNNCQWSTPYEQQINSRPLSCGPSMQQWFFAYNLNTGEWREDNSQSIFAKKNGLHHSNISLCLHGKQRCHKSWIFEYLSI